MACPNNEAPTFALKSSPTFPSRDTAVGEGCCHPGELSCLESVGFMVKRCDVPVAELPVTELPVTELPVTEPLSSNCRKVAATYWAASPLRKDL